MSDHLGTREIQHSIDGRYTASITRQTFAKRSFLNNLPSARVAEGGDPDLDAAVTAVRSALHGEWGRMNDGGANCGRLISQEHRDTVLSYYAKAIEEGASLVTRGGVPDKPGERAGGALQFYTELRNVRTKLWGLKHG